MSLQASFSLIILQCCYVDLTIQEHDTAITTVSNGYIVCDHDDRFAFPINLTK